MTRKYWQYQILLVALVCVTFVCPLFCAAYEQKMCNRSMPAESGSSCCQKAKTDATNESETPSETDTSCCVSGLEIVLPNDTYNLNTTRESVEEYLVSTLPLSSILPVAQEQLLHFTLPPKLVISSLHPNLSRRGPPNTHS
ncbi:hypothetical protein F4212_11320 [Candidatus Poribacteria bacterium]|nr:hypothetical protein [Candidatus Poribacteria bacterium]